MHITCPQPEQGKHPLFNMAGRRHHEDVRSKEWQFKVQKKYLVPIDHDKEDK